MKWIFSCLISGLFFFASSGQSLALTRFVFTGHTYPRLNQLRSIIKQINSVDPEFIVFGGDLIPGSVGKQPIEQQWREFYSSLQESIVPVFLVPGNHDSDFAKHWRELPYAFSYKGSRFIFIDSNSAYYPEPFRLPLKTIDFIRSQVSDFDGKIFLFVHHVIWLPRGKAEGVNVSYPAENWQEVEAILIGKEAYVIAGDGNLVRSRSDSGVYYLASALSDHSATAQSSFLVAEVDGADVRFSPVVLESISWYKRLFLIISR